jgi:hypothetical protein
MICINRWCENEAGEDWPEVFCDDCLNGLHEAQEHIIKEIYVVDWINEQLTQRNLDGKHQR